MPAAQTNMSKTKQTRKPKSFALFPRLPPELRAEIWKLASFSDPRNISVNRYKFNGWSADFETEYRYRCKSTMPAILHACREARGEGLKHYKLMDWVPEAANKIQVAEEKDNFLDRTYINWKVDRIVIFNAIEYTIRSQLVRAGSEYHERYYINKLHHDDRSSTYDLLKKLTENNVKFLAVDTGNDSWVIGNFFSGLYPWKCEVQEIIFFNSQHKRFRWDMSPLSWKAFPQSSLHRVLKEPTLVDQFLVDLFRAHAKARKIKVHRRGKDAQPAGRNMPILITPVGYKGREMEGSIFNHWLNNT